MRRALWVLDLDDRVDEAMLQAAFGVFGTLSAASIVQAGKGLVEFEDVEDAWHAKENMHLSEVFGRVIQVKEADPAQISALLQGTSASAVWEKEH